MRMIKLKDGHTAIDLCREGVKVIYNEYCAPVMIIDDVNHRIVFNRRDDEFIEYVKELFNAYTFTEVEQNQQDFRASIDNI